jgi:hypothetical protein
MSNDTVYSDMDIKFLVEIAREVECMSWQQSENCFRTEAFFMPEQIRRLEKLFGTPDKFEGQVNPFTPRSANEQNIP